MTTEELDAELRRVFAHAGAATDVPESARARLTGREYRPRQVHRGLGAGVGTLAVVTAAAVAIPLATGNSPAPLAAGTTLRLDSYQFVMPPGYHPTHGRGCMVVIGIAVPGAVAGGPAIVPPRTGPRRIGPAGPANVLNLDFVQVTGFQAAASAHGGCIYLELTPPYRPTHRVPDPYAGGFATFLVRVGHHRALFFQWGSGIGRDGRLVRPRKGSMQLFVQLPTKHGLVRDLVAGSDRLTARQLITIVRQGLASAI